MVTLPVTSNSCAYPSNSNRFQMQLCERTLRTWIDDRNERIQKNLATGWSLSFSYDDVKVVDSTTRFGQILRHWKIFLRVYLEFGLIFNLIWAIFIVVNGQILNTHFELHLTSDQLRGFDKTKVEKNFFRQLLRFFFTFCQNIISPPALTNFFFSRVRTHASDL